VFYIKGVKKNYWPDILIKNKNIVVSIKGWLKDDVYKKEKMFTKEHPEYKYIVLTVPINFLSYNFADCIFNYYDIIKNPNLLLQECV
jgi:hypothetical protein